MCSSKHGYNKTLANFSKLKQGWAGGGVGDTFDKSCLDSARNICELGESLGHEVNVFPSYDGEVLVCWYEGGLVQEIYVSRFEE